MDGLLRSSLAAKNAGLSFDQAVAYLTILREASGRTGREVGNAFNSILSMIRRTSSINTFKDLGIEVFADEAVGKLKGVDTLFQAIAERWNKNGEAFQDAFVKATQDTELFSEELAIATGLQDEFNAALEEYSDIEKRDIAQSSSGIYRRNYFIALIENLAKAQDVLANMTDAAGYSMRENERTMEALEKKVQSLKTAFTMLAVEIGEAGLLDVIKGAVDYTRELIEAFEALPEPIKKLLIMIGETVALYGIANLAMKTFFVGGMTTRIAEATKATKALTGETMVLVGAQGTATLATTAFTGALGRFILVFKTVPYLGQIAILTALGGTIYSVATSMQDATEKAKEMMKQNSEAADKAKGLADEIEKLTKKYETLAKQEEDSAEKSDDLKKVTKELTDIVPTAIVEFDEMGNAITNIGTASEEAAKKVADLRAEVLRNAEANAAIAKASLPELEKALKEAEVRRDLIKSKFSISNYQGVILGGRETGATGWDQLKWFFGATDEAEMSQRAGGLYAEAIKEYEEAYRAVKEAEALINIQDLLEAGKSPFTPTSTGGTGLSKDPDAAKKAIDRLLQQREYYRHLLSVEQISIEDYITALEGLEHQLISVGAEEKNVWSIQEEIFSLRKQEAQKVYDTMYSDSMDFYRHETALARMSAETQIQYIQDLARKHEWAIDRQRQLELESFNLYKSELSKQQTDIEKAYQERIDLIDAEAEARTKALQARIDALDEEDEGAQREESERQHSKTIEELWEQLRYHQLRTGAEHAKAIVETEQKIKEENRRWQLQLDDWERDDKKKSLQQQIKDIKEAAEEEKKIWKQKYDEIKSKWDEWAVSFAQAAIDDPQWLNIGKSIGQQIADGFSGSISQMESALASVGGKIPQTSSISGRTGTYTNPDGSVVPTTGQGYVGTDGFYHPSGGIRGIDNVFDAGGLAYGRGLMMKDTIRPERVLSPQLTDSFERLVNALITGRVSTTQTHTDNRRTVQLNGPLLNVEKASFEDRADMEIFGRELGREVQKMGR